MSNQALPLQDQPAPASSYERQARLLSYIQAHQRISVPQVVEAFAISVATARRDLDALAERGHVQRVHGGAVALQQAPPEPPVMQRTDEQAVEKRRIGQAAAALVQEGETLFLGTGSTVLEVARNLRQRANLTVITNSIPVVNMLAGAPGVTLVCLGGELRKSEMSLIGHIAEQALAELRTSRVILGIRAIDLEHRPDQRVHPGKHDRPRDPQDRTGSDGRGRSHQARPRLDGLCGAGHRHAHAGDRSGRTRPIRPVAARTRGARGAGLRGVMLLSDFKPRSKLVTRTTLVDRPRFPVIDAHNHLAAPFGGGWDQRPVAELLDTLNQPA